MVYKSQLIEENKRLERKYGEAVALITVLKKRLFENRFLLDEYEELKLIKFGDTPMDNLLELSRNIEDLETELRNQNRDIVKSMKDATEREAKRCNEEIRDYKSYDDNYIGEEGGKYISPLNEMGM
jgi:hypothetical protein